MARFGYGEVKLLTDEEMRELEMQAAFDEQEDRERFEVVDDEEPPWTDADEAGLDEYEERRRVLIAEGNEY